MKYSPDLIEGLRHRLQQPLPGLEAHMNMAPSVRRLEVQPRPDARRSAVLVLLYPHADCWYIPFMRRTDDGRVHGGQISFPGGGHDPGDRDYTHTALREAHEEMGIPPARVQVLGDLTELYIPPSNSLVYPRLAFMSERPAFVPDPVEVAEIIEVEVGQFMERHRQGQHQVEIRPGMPAIQAPGFLVNAGELIWGATAMMMAEVVHLLEAATVRQSVS